MARHIHQANGEEPKVWEYYFWPIGIGTPHWLDNNRGEYRPPFTGLDRVWLWLQYARLIRLRRVPEAERHIAR